jgi:hypothetical protein
MRGLIGNLRVTPRVLSREELFKSMYVLQPGQSQLPCSASAAVAPRSRARSILALAWQTCN